MDEARSQWQRTPRDCSGQPLRFQLPGIVRCFSLLHVRSVAMKFRYDKYVYTISEIMLQALSSPLQPIRILKLHGVLVARCRYPQQRLRKFSNFTLTAKNVFTISRYRMRIYGYKNIIMRREMIKF